MSHWCPGGSTSAAVRFPAALSGYRQCCGRAAAAYAAPRRAPAARLHALRSHLHSTEAPPAVKSRGAAGKQVGNAPVYTVVLTGGPCGGKTSSEAQLSATLADAGFDVYFAPEVPSILIRGGAAYPGLAPENSHQLLVFEKGIVDLQLQVEESFLAVARSTGRPSVVVLDRGLLDIPAYLPRDNWLQMLGKMGGV